MRHIFYFTLLLILSTSSILNAQVPISLSYDGIDVTNSEITLIRDLGMEIHVTNNGDTDLDIVTEITDILTPADTQWEVCWGVCVLPIGPMVIPGTVKVAAGETNTIDFHVTFVSGGNTDPANISFHIYETGVSGDYITLRMDTEHVGVNSIDQSQFMSIYPNPATSFFNIKVSQEYRGSEIIITNVIGKTVKSFEAKESEYRFSTNELSAGIYFVSLIKNKEILSTKKLIVN